MKVSVDGVEFRYKSASVLEGITLELDGAGLTSIIGPNGVGKTTFLHCINRLLTPSSGTILVDDVDVKEYKTRDLAKVVGYVPYSGSKGFPLTVLDTVVMGRHPYSTIRSTKKDVKAAYETLDMLEISEFALRPFSDLSAGQRQKVMLARGIVQEPRILLLDEPTANLDIKHQMEVTKILLDLSRSKDMNIIMVSHDLNIAAKYSDRVVMMHQGKIFRVGTPAEVITSENLRTVYDVEAEITEHCGRPYVLLNGPL